ncbi:PAS domain-containing sensor histidine kinase [Spartinivicinus ruber]|uniref:PAS domain-containing sensor histidine kinase n=1 Tax=Spartinivicinus ruber TaxID=2683272 RepID=UPI0013D69060|nr:ATP-binding protein [Spartinivicinus ruber]
MIRGHAEGKFRMLVSHNADPILVVSPQGQVKYANFAAKDFFQFNQTSLEGLPFGYPLSTETPVEIEVYNKADKSICVAEMRVDEVEWQGEHCKLITLRDITVHKQLEQNYQQTITALQHANKALEKSNLELQQFAYLTSHNLQTPLRSISGFIQLLQSNYQDKLDDQANEWINRSVESTKKLQTLILDLLTYSRVDTRQMPFLEISFQTLVDEAFNVLEESITETGAEITCDKLPTVIGDHAQLVLLMQNLIGNAIKYRSKKPPKIHFFAEKQANEWCFCVSDNGIGINPQNTNKIFDVFYRLHTQQTYPGTGIGLALCRRIIERHGGRIWVKSQLGQGSQFYFTLPLKKESPRVWC